jgi:hypothetical protein
MNFVTFHVDTTKHKSTHSKVNLAQQEYVRMIELMIRSARFFHPEASATVLTDFESDFSTLSTQHTCLRYPIQFATLMYDRTVAQSNFVQEYDFSSPAFFIDSDILVNEPLDDLFKLDFDIGLTWRKSVDMPINGGFLVINNRRPECVRRFFRIFQEIYSRDYASQAAWYGDQRALRDCVGVTYQDMQRNAVLEAHGCKIAFLSCETYNFSPENHIRSIRKRFRDKAVLHFKGERKSLMDLYWNAYLRPLELGGFFERARARLFQSRIALHALLKSGVESIDDPEE